MQQIAAGFGDDDMLSECGAPVAQWVVRPTHTRLVTGSKHDCCKNPLVFAMITS